MGVLSDTRILFFSADTLAVFERQTLVFNTLSLCAGLIILRDVNRRGAKTTCALGSIQQLLALLAPQREPPSC